MGHMLPARARTTPEVRREIQNSQENLMVLAKRWREQQNHCKMAEKGFCP